MKPKNLFSHYPTDTVTPILTTIAVIPLFQIIHVVRLEYADNHVVGEVAVGLEGRLPGDDERVACVAVDIQSSHGRWLARQRHEVLQLALRARALDRNCVRLHVVSVLRIRLQREQDGLLRVGAEMRKIDDEWFVGRSDCKSFFIFVEKKLNYANKDYNVNVVYLKLIFLKILNKHKKIFKLE